jgi:hypothetical protein
MPEGRQGRSVGRQQGGCVDKGDEYRACDEVGSSIEGSIPNNVLCMARAATIAPAIPNAAPEPTWLLLAGYWVPSSYDLILLVQSLGVRSCTREGTSAGGGSAIRTRSVL